MKKYLYFLPFILLWSCNNEDDDITPVENNTFTAYPKGYFITTIDGYDTIKLEYRNNKVTKRVGDWIQTGMATGYRTIFSKSLETNISYTDKTASLTKFSKLDWYQYSNDIYVYTLNGQQISEATLTYKTRPNYTEKYVYVYENNQIKYIDFLVTDHYYTNDLRSRRDFYFNAKGNLDSLVYRDADYDFYDESVPSYIDYKKKERKVSTFSNYDQSQNPFQNLGVFTDLYYKSLSKNNFRKTETKEYDKDGKPTLNFSESSWDYEYENNEVKILK